MIAWLEASFFAARMELVLTDQTLVVRTILCSRWSYRDDSVAYGGLSCREGSGAPPFSFMPVVEPSTSIAFATDA